MFSDHFVWTLHTCMNPGGVGLLGHFWTYQLGVPLPPPQWCWPHWPFYAMNYMRWPPNLHKPLAVETYPFCRTGTGQGSTTHRWLAKTISSKLIAVLALHAVLVWSEYSMACPTVQMLNIVRSWRFWISIHLVVIFTCMYSFSMKEPSIKILHMGYWGKQCCLLPWPSTWQLYWVLITWN